MKPSAMQLLCAKSRLWQIAFWGGPLCVGLAIAVQLDASENGFFGAVLFGASFGVIITYFSLRALYLVRARINGAPFREGDTVQVLAGRHRGRISRVYEEWEDYDRVRVELGEPAKENLTDVYSSVELCREANREPIVAPDSREALHPES